MPKEALIAAPAHREVARMYAERRDLPVVDVVDAAKVFAQPELLQTQDEQVASVSFDTDAEPGTGTLISPFPRTDEA
jgi:hypothetical protein